MPGLVELYQKPDSWSGTSYQLGGGGGDSGGITTKPLLVDPNTDTKDWMESKQRAADAKHKRERGTVLRRIPVIIGVGIVTLLAIVFIVIHHDISHKHTKRMDVARGYFKACVDVPPTAVNKIVEMHSHLTRLPRGGTIASVNVEDEKQRREGEIVARSLQNLDANCKEYGRVLDEEDQTSTAHREMHHIADTLIEMASWFSRNSVVCGPECQESWRLAVHRMADWSAFIVVLIIVLVMGALWLVIAPLVRLWIANKERQAAKVALADHLEAQRKGREFTTSLGNIAMSLGGTKLKSP